MKAKMPTILYIHATAIAIDGQGILISGPSKAGKSTLAEALITASLERGFPSMLIGDDRVGLMEQQGRIHLSPHPVIAGMIERRGTGILRVPHCKDVPAALELALTGGTTPRKTRIERLPGLFIEGLLVQPRPDAAALLPLVLAALPQ
jgi:serine kinase of HPr protein (carbohydrate metabolism regulator)